MLKSIRPWYGSQRLIGKTDIQFISLLAADYWINCHILGPLMGNGLIEIIT